MELITDLNNGVYKITLNRPEVYNSFNKGMALSLQKELDYCAQNDEIRTIIITVQEKLFAQGKTLQRQLIPTDRSLNP